MTETFKEVYKIIPDNWLSHILLQKEKADQLKELFSVINSKEMSLARAHVESALLLAKKAIELHCEKI